MDRLKRMFRKPVSHNMEHAHFFRLGDTGIVLIVGEKQMMLGIPQDDDGHFIITDQAELYKRCQQLPTHKG